jgi:hypothetical protein
MKKEITKLIVKLAEQYGFVLIRKSKHFVFKHPNGAIFVSGQSSSDGRALLNAERDLKRLTTTP